MYIHIWYIHAVWFCGQNKQKGFSFCQWMEGGSTNVYIYQWVDGCVCAYTHKNIHIYIHTYMYEHIQWIHNHVRTYIHTWHKRMYIHTYKNTHIRTYLHSYMYTYIHADIHIYVHTCMHACTMTWYILTYTQWKICTHIHEYIHILPRVWEAYWQLGTGATAGNSTHLPATRKMTVLFNNKNINSTTFEYVRWILVFGNSFLATRRLGVLSNQKRSSGRLLKFECVQ